MNKGEDELFGWIASRFAAARRSAADPSILLGPGDDMAHVTVGPGGMLAACDMLTDGVDFDSTLHTPQQMGRKAMAANLSDCAAMAVRPRWALISVTLPASWSMSQAQELYAGAEGVAREFDCRIIGGDTNSWDRPLVIDVTILAEPWRCDSNGPASGDRILQPVRRSGMRPGDALFVTGELGGSIRGHHLRFTPRVHEARLLAATLGEDLHAMMDISDGLSVDAARMAAASGCGIELNEAALLHVVSDDAEAQAAEDCRTVLSHVLDDGEDFELLLAVSAGRTEEAAALSWPGGRGSLPCRLTRIGQGVADAGLWLTREHGTREPIAPGGWRHFQ